MKKLSLSLMLNVSLALMLALSLIYPQSVAVSFGRCMGDSGDGYLCDCRWCRRVCRGVCAGTLRAGAAAGIAGREDCHVAVFAAGAVAQTGSGSDGDGGDVYLAGRCRVDFYRTDLSRGIAVFPADTYGLPSAS
ncbi:Head completion/stabilization protein (GpL) [Escherichia coli]|uniref:Head completion/stabilization protein (GpL) n=1 Tax=Escherichia coli TaxID=562 RepID=A0A376JPX4_ECOLX|nr:Head completion/stabilization protein (GpL) [Escherichia coli]